MCKWTYEVDAATGKDKGWSGDFFRRAGMGELAEEGFKRLGTDVRRYAKKVIGKCTVFFKKILQSRVVECYPPPRGGQRVRSAADV